MKIKLLDFGYDHAPFRAHDNDAGADVYLSSDVTINGNSVCKIPLGFGLELPDGYAAFVFPRSSLSAKGITCELPPIDSGYRGQIHAIVTNNTDHTIELNSGERIGQIVVVPIIVPDFVTEVGEARGIGGFGSTGK